MFAMDTPLRSDLLRVLGEEAERFATLYVPSPSATATADQQWDIRVKNALSEIEEVDGSLMAQASAVLTGVGHEEGAARLVVLADDRVLLDHAMHRPVDHLDVRLGPTPALLPMLEASQIDVPHVAVMLDRTGADVYFRIGVAEPDEVETVEGDTEHVRRSHPGGWSQRRFQQRAENTWERNAKQAVEELMAMYPDVDLVVVGGDVRSVAFFNEHAPAGPAVVEVEGSRSADHDAFLDNADRVLRDRAAQVQVEAIQQAREAVAVGTGAAGHDALTMLTNGLAGTLIVGNDHEADDRATSRFDFSIPAHLGEVADWPGSDHPVDAPVTEGAVMLAARLGTRIVVVPSAAMSEFDHHLVTLER